MSHHLLHTAMPDSKRITQEQINRPAEAMMGEQIDGDTGQERPITHAAYRVLWVIKWLLLPGIVVVLLAIAVRYINEFESERFDSKMRDRLRPIISAIQNYGGDLGTGDLPEDFAAIQIKYMTSPMPENIYTGKPMRCIALTDAPSPGDFSYLRANMTYLITCIDNFTTQLITKPCGYYLLVYGSRLHSIPDWSSKVYFGDSYVADELRRMRICYFTCPHWVEEDIYADIQPLGEILLRQMPPTGDTYR
jgi:hypothetical protein